ncbi:hypothetical protein ACN28S_64905 [Cystobacter fuscus]
MIVAAADCHSLAVRSDGTVWAWGSNTRGKLGDGNQMGDGMYREHLTPVQVLGPSGAVSVAEGSSHSLGAPSDGGWGWATTWSNWGGTAYRRRGPRRWPGSCGRPRLLDQSGGRPFPTPSLLPCSPSSKMAKGQVRPRQRSQLGSGPNRVARKSTTARTLAGTLRPGG